MECQHGSGVCAHRHLRTSYIFILLMEEILNIFMCETALLPIYLLFYAVFSGRFGYISWKGFSDNLKGFAMIQTSLQAIRSFKNIWGIQERVGQLSTSKWKNSQHEPINKVRIPFFDVLRSRNLKRPSSCSCASSLCILPTNESAEGEAIQMDLWKRFPNKLLVLNCIKTTLLQQWVSLFVAGQAGNKAL